MPCLGQILENYPVKYGVILGGPNPFPNPVRRDIDLQKIIQNIINITLKLVLPFINKGVKKKVFT